MRFRKLVAILAIASLAFWTPSIVPVKARIMRCDFHFFHFHHEVTYNTIDTAFAFEWHHLPCPTPQGSSAWPVVAVLAGTVSVMLNAAIVWKTQCRELTSGEAMTSTFLPLIGIAFDAQASKCPR